VKLFFITLELSCGDRVGSYFLYFTSVNDTANHTRPRGAQSGSTLGFIHGELGPDHILVNESLTPFLIDIEWAMFFDIEHEHSFLELRFGD
jgi:hypothetical protein